MRTRIDNKSFNAIGPVHLYYKVALLTYYRPDLWRKVAKLLCNLRRMNRLDFTGDCFNRMTKYAHRAWKDTKLPSMVRIALRDCIMEEFKFDINP